MVEVADVVRAVSADAWGGEGRDATPALLAELATEWGLTVGAALGGGTESFVVSATTSAGAPAVLKLVVPRDDARTGREADAIWEWGVAERVSTGPVATETGPQPEGAQMSEVADRIAADPESRRTA